MLTPATPEATTPPTRPTVLCIDDDPLVLLFYRGLLESHGYRVLTAGEGLLGLDMAQREHPDVILLDIMLRGLSGYDICRKFRSDPAFRDIPILLLTAWEDPSVLNAGLAAGATRVLRKPADAEVIRAAIAQVVSERGGPPRRDHAS